MKNREDLELIYTSKENDNIKIWPCTTTWTQEDVNNNFSDYDQDSRKLILKYLTSEPHIAEGMNLITSNFTPAGLSPFPAGYFFGNA